MFYITSIKESGFEKSKAYFYINKLTGEISQGASCEVFSFTVYDDEDTSVETITSDYLIHCIKLGVKIRGVQVIKSQRYGFQDSEYDSVIVRVMKPFYRSIMLLKNYTRISFKTGNFNEEFINKFNCNYNPSYIAVGDIDGLGRWICMGNCGYIDTSSTRNLRKKIESCEVSSLYLGNIFLVKSIRSNNNITAVYAPNRIYKLLGKWDLSVIDLYKLTLLYPELTIGCDIVDENTFVVNTLTDKYIFNVRDGFYRKLLRDKVSGLNIFALH